MNRNVCDWVGMFVSAKKEGETPIRLVGFVLKSSHTKSAMMMALSISQIF